jgi:hypothetical protein
VSGVLHLAPWRQQPQEAVGLSRASSLTDGLQMLLVPAGGGVGDAVNPGRVWTRSASSSVAPTPAGIGAVFTGANNRHYSFTGYGEIVGGVGTFFLWMPRVGVKPPNGPVFFGTNTGSASWWQLDNDSRFWVWGQQANPSPAFTGLYNTNNRSLVFTSGGTGGSLRAYVDGRDTGQSWSIGTVPGFATGAKTFNFGRWIGGDNWNVDGDVVIAGYSNRPWSPIEARWFHDNPWQLFAPRQIWVPSAAAAPALPTLSAPRAKAGSVTSTGWISQVTAS